MNPSPSSTHPVALVALDTPLSEALDYALTEELIGNVQFGSLVEVPLRGRTAQGWVIGFLLGPERRADTPAANRRLGGSAQRNCQVADSLG